MIMIKIAYKLLFPTFMISISPPNLHLNYILYTAIIDDKVCPFLIPDKYHQNAQQISQGYVLHPIGHPEQRDSYPEPPAYTCLYSMLPAM